jgi:LCP family protein required for cell wall assembly
MRAPRRGRFVAALLSLLVPGTGQIYLGARRRGLVLLGAFAGLVAVLAALALRSLELGSLVNARLLVAVLVANAALLAFRCFAVVDAWRSGRGAASAAAVTGLVAVVALACAPHVAAGYVAVRGYTVLDRVFADAEPDDVLPAQGLFLTAAPAPPPPPAALPPIGRRVGGPQPVPDSPLPRPRRVGPARPLDSSAQVLVHGDETGKPWVTLLLLGSDGGPGIWGERTDTMIVVALQRSTGRATAFGVPRNLVEVPLAGVGGRLPARFDEPLNALYARAGASALKQTISRLLGIRVDYYALVDLKGFADLVDALGGVDIRVRERIVDSVTRPAWGEPKPTIDVVPGRTYHFFGATALAYVRSRKASSDYTRMARQRCFLSALAQQLDVVRVLRHFPALAGIVEESVRTDIPLSRVPDLARLAAAIDRGRTLTETFGLRYFSGRRASDRYPIPDIPRIRATVRDMILRPGLSRERRAVESAAQSC